jgi:hypothetical protein
MNPDDSSAPGDSSVHFALRFDGPQRRPLELLHRRSVAIQLIVEGEARLMSGQGTFERDPDLGSILRISFPDHPDDGEFLVVEKSWTGRIEAGDAVGCDFLIRLL